jgi:DNA-binding IclR family transcriptional regulator
MTAQDGAKANRYRIEAVDRALQLLDVLAGAQGATAAQLAAKMNANRSLVFRMLSTLTDRGFVSKDEHNAYRLGPRLVSLSEQAASGDIVVEASRRALDDLLKDSQETLYLVVRDGLDVMCVATRTSPQKIRLVADVGFRRKIGVGSAAMVMMAHGQPEFVEQVLNQNFYEGAPAPMRTRPQAIAELPQVRAQGYHETTTDEPGIYSISVPIWDWRGDMAAVLVLDAPSSRVPPEQAAILCERIILAGEEISAMLGGARRST